VCSEYFVLRRGLANPQPVVEGLFREGGVGGELFADVAGVAAAAMRNPAHEGLSLGAVHAAEALARRLAAAGPQARPRRAAQAPRSAAAA